MAMEIQSNDIEI